MPITTNMINNLPSNPNAMIKTRFAIKFIEAMNRLNSGGEARDGRYKRYRAVRAAARMSMASAVGRERAWSRAVLRKMKRHRSLLRHFQLRRKRRRFVRTRTNPRQNLGFVGKEEDLRGLVPGGEAMGFCSLLSETAHYIQCLQTQVHVMTDILHTYSS